MTGEANGRHWGGNEHDWGGNCLPSQHVKIRPDLSSGAPNGVEGRHTGAAFIPRGHLLVTRGGIIRCVGAPHPTAWLLCVRGAATMALYVCKEQHLFPRGAYRCRRVAYRGGIYSQERPSALGAAYRGGIYFPGAPIGVEGWHIGVAFILGTALGAAYRGGIYFPGAPIIVEGRYLFSGAPIDNERLYTGAPFIPPGRLLVSRGGIPKAASIFRGSYRRRGSAYRGGIYFSRAPIDAEGRHLFSGAPNGVEGRHTGAAFIPPGHLLVTRGGITRCVGAPYPTA